jgi:hypothetical protein
MRLCFGSYLAVLVSCKAPEVDNKVLCEALLHSVAPNFEFTFDGQENPDRVREDASSRLLLCKQNVSRDVIKPSRSVSDDDVIAYFKENVEILIDANRRKDVILAIKGMIASDPIVEEKKKKRGIDDDTVVDIVNGTTKRALATQSDFCFSAFLAGIFLFVVRFTNNRSGKPTIKSVTDEYILSFADRISEIKLFEEDETKKAALLKAVDSKTANNDFAEIVADTVVDKFNSIQLSSKRDRGLLVTLLTESRGDCLCCNKKLGTPKKNQQSSDTSEIVYLKMNDSEESCYANAVVLCKNCAAEVDQLTIDEKNDLLNKKRDCANYVEFLTKLDNFKFQKEIETVLREINSNKNNVNLERSDPNDLVEISQKIHEPYLKDKIDASMTRLYKKVKEICSRLEQEIGFDTEVFGSLMKSAQITLTNVLKTKPEIVNPQEYAIQLLQERLCSQVGQKHQDACLIIINYLIKRCDLFNETSKQS